MKHYYLLWLLLSLALPGRAQSLDPTFQPTTLLSQSTSVTVLAMTTQPDGKPLVAGNFQAAGGTLSNNVLRLNPDLTRDLSFRPALGANGPVQALAVQPDGKVLIGGSFTTYAGTATGPVARLLPTGELDPAFRPDPALAGGQVAALAVQADGGVLVGGLASASLPGGLVRLLPSGALDPAFSSGSGASNGTSSGARVLTLAVQPADGRIVAGGSFTSFGGRTSQSLMRLLPTGAPDPDFALLGYAGGQIIYSVVVLASGTILAGGYPPGIYSGNLRGFLPSGAPDVRFSLDFTGTGVRSIQVDAAGRILVAGWLNYLSNSNSYRTPGAVRLLPNGTLDPTFGLQYTSAYLNSVLPLADGRVLVGGYLPAGNAVGLNLLAATGAVDPAFDLRLQLRGSISQVVPQADGGLLVQGTYTSLNGQAVSGRLQRLGPDGRLVQDRQLPALTGFTYGTLFPQPDGQIYATVVARSCGSLCFGTNPVYTIYLRRIQADNTLDPNFNVRILNTSLSTNTSVTAIQQLFVSSTGALLLQLNLGATRLLRIQPSGATAAIPLPSFLQPVSAPIGSGIASPQLRQVLLQPDGKLLVSYDLVTYFSTSATSQRNLARLLPDGSPDPDFALVASPVPTNVAFSLGPLQPDGKLLVAGAFISFAGVPAPTGLVRLLPSGAVDATFQPAAGLAPLVPLAPLPDGRLLVQANVQPGTARLRCLLPDGTTDTSFAPVAVTSASYPTTSWSVVLQPGDNKPVLFGDFSEVAGQLRTGLARLGATTALASRQGEAAIASLYPNPAHNGATLVLATALTQADNVHLCDLLGREVYSQPVPAHTKEVQLSLGSLRPGLYLLRCGTATKQLLVN